MKRKVYIFLFAVFGLAVAFLLHMILEITYINLLTWNFDLWSLGFSWRDWFLVHDVFSVFLEIVGFLAGIYFGKKFASYFRY